MTSKMRGLTSRVELPPVPAVDLVRTRANGRDGHSESQSKETSGRMISKTSNGRLNARGSCTLFCLCGGRVAFGCPSLCDGDVVGLASVAESATALVAAATAFLVVSELTTRFLAISSSSKEEREKEEKELERGEYTAGDRCNLGEGPRSSGPPSSPSISTSLEAPDINGGQCLLICT